MKYKLTPEHEAQLKPWAEKWIANALQTRTEPLSFEEIERIKDAVEHMYKAANLTPPPRSRIVIAPSPFVARFAAGAASWIWHCRKSATYEATSNAIRNATDEATEDATDGFVKACYALAGKGGLECAKKAYKLYQGGNMWSAWDSFLSFFKEVVQLDIDYSKYEGWLYLARHTGFRYVHKEFCIVSELPIKLTVNERNQGHCDGDHYIKWRDGTGIYMLDGVRVPEYLAVTPSEQLDIQWYLKQDNADIKAQFIKKYGIERMLEMGKLVDRLDNDPNECVQKSQYELWDMAKIMPAGQYAPYLKMTNQTTGVFHVEGVHPDCRTVIDALEWRNKQKNLNIIAIA